jgi:hypothetical protein
VSTARHIDARVLSDDELGALLRRAWVFPPTPDVVPTVLARLPMGGAPSRLVWPRIIRVLALALLAVLLAVAVAIAAIIGVRGIRIATIDQVERPSPSEATSPRSTDLARVGAALALGRALTLDQIDRQVDMPVQLPDDPALGPPDAAFLDRAVLGGMVSMIWASGPGLPLAHETGVGLLISQFDGRINPDGILKLRDQGVAVDRIEVAGANGWWMHGASHIFLRRTDPSQQWTEVPTRLATDTLIWERDGLTYRLEGRIGLERAIAIAESMHGNRLPGPGVSPSAGAWGGAQAFGARRKQG